MEILQTKYSLTDATFNGFGSLKPQLILAFGSGQFLKQTGILKQIAKSHPQSVISGCSTSGEIMAENVSDNSLVVTAVQFDTTEVKQAQIDLSDYQNDKGTEAGITLANNLPHANLKHVLVFSDGLQINGTKLVDGMSSALPKGVTVSGGLAGDGSDFNQTYTVGAKGQIEINKVIAIGLYGEALQVNIASKGGWNSFGLDRLVTKSEGNVLYEIDGKPALELYKSFLGDQAQNLPSSGLLFPLNMRSSENSEPVVRTILGINNEENSLTFAGDIPQGSFVRLMKANADRLINGAEEAAVAIKKESQYKAELALLVSCVGRKLVLKQLVEEEIEAVSEVLNKPTIMGFYSYGELAPFGKHQQCQLHNQTMTITTFSEKQ